MKFSRQLMPCFALSVIILSSGCSDETRGFALPPGDAEEGKRTFVSLGCSQCHSVAGEIDLHPLGDLETHFELGGYVSKVRTYGDLVTSIINPDHKISVSHLQGVQTSTAGNSNMIEINSFMTVEELIDITSFLKETYKVVPPRYIPYQTGI